MRTPTVSKPYDKLRKGRDLPIKTPKTVRCAYCPVCRSKDYVRPYAAGLVDEDAVPKLMKLMEQGRISIGFGCMVEDFYSWDCERCCVLFHFNEPLISQSL